MKLALQTALLLSLIPISACKAETQSFDGLYEMTRPNAAIISLEEGQKCEAPYHILEGTEDMCVEDMETTDQLALKKTPDGHLEFMAQLWFFNGHTCGIHETAKPYQNGWRFEKEGAEDYEQCILDISIDDKEITFKTDDLKDCKFYCGMRGSLNRATFPLSSKTDEAPQNMDCLLNVQEDCKN